jgi:hypothetical protein
MRFIDKPKAESSVRVFNRRSVIGRGERHVRQSCTASYPGGSAFWLSWEDPMSAATTVPARRKRKRPSHVDDLLDLSKITWDNVKPVADVVAEQVLQDFENTRIALGPAAGGKEVVV